MDFLKELLGAELFEQVQQALNSYNSKPENAQAPIKLGNLGSGDYISKGKYDSLEADHAALAKKLEEANALAEQLKKAPDLTEFQGKVDDLTRQITKTKVDAAVQAAFIRAGVVDPEYMSFKLKGMGEMELDDRCEVKGLDSKLDQLKKLYPNCFAATQHTGRFEGFDPMKDVENDFVGMTKSDILRMPYGSRLSVFEQDPGQYRTIMNK